ncbi:MAG: hypothetical protein R2706_21080 [Acidimicrobiales bacterium]
MAEPPYFADDPLAEGEVRDKAKLLTQLPTARPGSKDWDKWLINNPEYHDWVADRWLGGERGLSPLPANFVETRIALHRLAAIVIAPIRFAANGKFGLRYTLGGFGTPFFGDDRQIRVQDGRLIDQRGSEARSVPITTLRRAAEFLETEIDGTTAREDDSPEVGDIDEPLAITLAGNRFLGDWYGMATAALEGFRNHAVDPSRVQLWPGHFDPAIEAGDDDNRASYGASPGDDAITEPYLYVGVWYPDRANIKHDALELDAESFAGSLLPLSEFPVGEDPVLVAQRFWGTFHKSLHRKRA